MQYHVETNKVKQDLIINQLSPNVKEYMRGVAEEDTVDAIHNNKFGILETMILPDNTELWAGSHQITPEDGVYSYSSMLQIVDSDSGQAIAYIAAPTAADSSSAKDLEDTSDANVAYFIDLAKTAEQSQSPQQLISLGC